jgi:hypothetical protein
LHEKFKPLKKLFVASAALPPECRDHFTVSVARSVVGDLFDPIDDALLFGSFSLRVFLVIEAFQNFPNRVERLSYIIKIVLKDRFNLNPIGGGSLCFGIDLNLHGSPSTNSGTSDATKCCGEHDATRVVNNSASALFKPFGGRTRAAPPLAEGNTSSFAEDDLRPR